MYKMIIPLTLALVATGPAVASETTEVMVPVHQFVDGFNRGDTKSALAVCADPMSITYEWHGPGACGKWFEDFDADAKKNEITDGIVTLRKPRHIDVTADRAYVVASANYTYKKNGKVVKETGSVITTVLQKGVSGWRITAWAWAKN